MTILGHHELTNSLKIWIPQIEIVNRADEFSPDNEVERKLKVTSTGRVRFTRMFRMRSLMGTHIYSYPYDIQLAELIISSADYSDTKIRTRCNVH